MGRIIYIDRSRIVTFQDCPRKRYWNYHHNGTGIQRKRAALPLVSGIAVHQALEGLLLGGDREKVIAEAVATYTKTVKERGLQQNLDVEAWFLAEQVWLLECVMRAWARYRLPRILAEYQVRSVEQELQNPIAPGMVQMVRLDAVILNLATVGQEILEFKTVSNPSYDWQQLWERNVQILANTQALEAVSGERCEGVKIEGLVLGQRKTETAKSSVFNGKRIRNSPYCYAWRTTNDFGLPVYERDYQAGKAWSKVAIYAEPGWTPAKWVADFTDLELGDLFQPLPPIRPVPAQMARWRRQTVQQEFKIAAALRELAEAEDSGDEGWVERVMDTYFPQHDSACKHYGSACEFEDACFDEGIGADPVGSGLYVARDPHHATENEE